MKEPTVVVNGQQLTVAQALTVRVAVTLLMSTMASEGLGEDPVGRTLAEGYGRACAEVLTIMQVKEVKGDG